MRTTRSTPAASPLEARITGSLRHRYAQELFRNSGQFPIATLLLEVLLEGPQIFFLQLGEQPAAALSPWGLAAGIGVHAGQGVEGLLGSAGVKGYDVIGDTVNTARRIEGAAAGGEVLVCATVRAALDPATSFGPRREVIAKGKQAPVAAYPSQ